MAPQKNVDVDVMTGRLGVADELYFRNIQSKCKFFVLLLKFSEVQYKPVFIYAAYGLKRLLPPMS